MTSGFSFKLDSSRDGALRQLQEQKAGPDLKDKPADQTLIDAVKKFTQDRIAALPEKFDGALVLVQGESDPDLGRATATIQVYGKTGHL